MTIGTSGGLLSFGGYAPSLDAIIGVLDIGLATLATLVLIRWSVRRRGRRSSRPISRLHDGE